MRLVTPSFEVVSARSTTSPEGWTPTGGAHRVVGFTHALFALGLQGLGAIKARPGYQYSEDGLTWFSPIGVAMTSGSSYKTTADWTYGDTVVALESGQAPLQYIRFGVLSLNTSGSLVQAAQAQLATELRVVPGGTVDVPMFVAKTRGHTTNEVFTPGAVVMPTIGITRIRAVEVELRGGSGDIAVQPAYELSNDGLTWSDQDELGAYVTAEGYDYNTTFLTASFTKQFIRFGVRAKNISGSTIAACQARLRIDWRAV